MAALEQTVTIINNSGKIISTGKQLLSIFQEAKGAYQDKRSQIKSDRLQRAQTFDHGTASRAAPPAIEHHYEDYLEDEDDDYEYDYKYQDDRQSRRAPAQGWYDGHSEAGSRASRRSRSTHSRHHHHQPRDRDGGSQYGGSVRSRRPPLTVDNLKTWSEVSSTAPSRAPPSAYRSPYAETMGASRMDLTHADARSVALTERRPGTALTRRRSFTQLERRSTYHPGDDQIVPRRSKEIDMHLAYGDIPPDLEHRVDLDPTHESMSSEGKAKALTRKVEFLLDEAHCLQHSATSTISHLQKNPDAAAAVALTLTELSGVVAKMSPAFLGLLKGSSPAVFALLASPQFLIGTGAVVGITVIMFGGWKIVKRVKEQQAAREALAFQGNPAPYPIAPTEYSDGVDEALVMDDDLSTIETWRRGIPASCDNESADLELITPQADRDTRRNRGDDFDTKSRRSTRTTKTTKTTKTAKSTKSKREVPERQSSRNATAESVAGTERSKKSSKKKENVSVKAIEDGRSQKSNELDMVFRPKPQRHGSNMLKALFKDKKDKEVPVRVR